MTRTNTRSRAAPVAPIPDELPSGDSVELKQRFAGLLQRLGLESSFEEVYALLVEGYSQPWRHYHALNHIRACLDRLDEVRDSLGDPDAVELALWFHDAVYQPTAADNELRSALLFDKVLGVSMPTPRADRIHAMIMATVHPSTPEDNDGRFLVDIDLSSFALPREEFLRDTVLLRKESARLTDAQFQHGMLTFFKKMLARPTIYLTDYFRAECEEQARTNLSDKVRELEAGQVSGAGE